MSGSMHLVAEDPKLFERSMEADPQQAVMIGKAIGALARVVLKEGGELTLRADGANQGIFVKIGNREIAITPHGGVDHDEINLAAASFGHASSEGTRSSKAEPHDLEVALIGTLQTYMNAEMKLRR